MILGGDERGQIGNGNRGREYIGWTKVAGKLPGGGVKESMVG
jgi:hypothetical protein